MDALYKHHERTTTVDLEADLQLREIGIDPVLKVLVAYSEVLGAKLHGITEESPSPELLVLSIAGALTLANDIVFTASQPLIRSNTSDGSDNKAVYVTGGGNAAVTRGATLSLYGNEYTSIGGQLHLAAGNISGGDIYLQTANTTRLTIAFGGTSTFSGPLVLSSTLWVTGVSTLTGSVGIGGSPVTYVALSLQSGALTGTTQYGITATANFSGTATDATSAYVRVVANNASLSVARGVHIEDPNKLGSTTLTTNYGLKIENQTAGGTTNYAIYTGTGAVRFGGEVIATSTLAVTGTSTLTGKVAIGASPVSYVSLYINNISLSGDTNCYGMYLAGAFPVAATTSMSGAYISVQSDAGSYTTTATYGLRVANVTKGVGHTITTQYGIKVENQDTGGTNYAIKTGLGLVDLGDELRLSAANTVSAGIAVASTNKIKLVVDGTTYYLLATT